MTEIELYNELQNVECSLKILYDTKANLEG